MRNTPSLFYDFEFLFGLGQALSKSLELLLLLDSQSQAFSLGHGGIRRRYPGSKEAAANPEFTGCLRHVASFLGQGHGPLLEFPIE